ncbi:transposable element Tc1 transposase [Trichonephila clavipes]|nr:transposable element Tc1 transposase [Trichonephila clavipes]
MEKVQINEMDEFAFVEQANQYWVQYRRLQFLLHFQDVCQWSLSSFGFLYAPFLKIIVPKYRYCQKLKTLIKHDCVNQDIYRGIVSARTIQCRLQQSGLTARRPLLGLPLTQNHRCLRRQWCKERRMWAAEWNEVVFTDESCIYVQTSRRLDSSLETPWREGAEQLRYALPHWSYTSQRYISKVLESVVLPYLQGLAKDIFQQDNVQPHVARIVQRFFINHQIELLPWPACSPDLSPIENMWSMVAQRLTQITSPATTSDQHWQCVEVAWSAVPQEHIQRLFESMLRRVARVISNNGSYSGY